MPYPQQFCPINVLKGLLWKIDLKCTSLTLTRKGSGSQLEVSKYGHIGLMVSMIRADVRDGQESYLKHLCCAIPELYTDILEPLSSIVHATELPSTDNRPRRSASTDAKEVASSIHDSSMPALTHTNNKKE